MDISKVSKLKKGKCFISTDAVFSTSERAMSCVKLAPLLVLALFPPSSVRKLLGRLIVFRFVLTFIQLLHSAVETFGRNDQVLDPKRKERSGLFFIFLLRSVDLIVVIVFVSLAAPLAHACFIQSLGLSLTI